MPSKYATDEERKAAKKESLRQAKLKYRSKPEAHEKAMEYSRKYCRDHRKELAEKSLANYYKKKEENPLFERVRNKEKAREYTKRYIREHREEYIAHAHARRAKLRDLDGKYTKNDIENLMSLQKCSCVYCRSDISNKYQVDHIIPISKGGSNRPENIQLLCGACNRRKSSKMPVDFAQSLGMLL